MKKSKRPKHKNWSRLLANKTPTAFASFFGLIMIIIGLTQIFAATPTINLNITPVAQNGNSGDTKTLSVNLVTNGNNVSKGHVHITFENSALNFVGFAGKGGNYTVTGYSSSNPSPYHTDLAFDFQAANLIGSNGDATLGTITVSLNYVNATTTNHFTFAKDVAASYNNSAYNVGTAGASITVYQRGAPANPPSNPPPSNNPPSNPPASPPNKPSSNSPPTTSPTSTTKPNSSSTSTTPTSTSTPAITQAATDTSSSDQSATTDQTATDTTASSDATQSATDINISAGQNQIVTAKKSPLPSILLIIGGVLLLGGAAFMYIKFIRNAPPLAITSLVDTGTGFAMSGLGIDHGEGPNADYTNAPVWSKSDNEEPVEVVPEETSTPDTSPSTSPAEALAQANLARLAAPAGRPPHTNRFRPHNPAMPSRVPLTPPSFSSEATQMDEPPEPEITDKLPADKVAKPNPDDQPDMFELAEQHPESFGSSHLVGHQAPDEPPTNEKEPPQGEEET